MSGKTKKPEAVTVEYTENVMLLNFPITPMAKPRMTRRDRWGSCRSKRVVKFFQWRAEFYRLMKGIKIRTVDLDGVLDVQFQMPMPQSWSRSKKQEKRGTPHRNRPDIDNMVKAVMDTLEDDSHIHKITAKKFWWDTGAILLRYDRNQSGYQRFFKDWI